MRNIPFILTILLFTSQMVAQGVKTQFEQANKLYQQDKFEEAADAYQEILRSGYESAGVYYNLGNCYFQLDQLGLSILNYRRAEMLDPYDDEIRHNLELAKKAAIDDFETMPLPIFRSAYLKLLLLFKADTWAKLSMAALGLLIIGSFLYLFTGLRRAGFIIGFSGILVPSLMIPMPGQSKAPFSA